MVIQCHVTELSVGITNSFYLLLLALCAVYTFKTRKLPKQFRETKGLALAINLDATNHLIVLSIVCTMDEQSLIRGRVVILSHPLAASAVLFPIYLPKFYSVVFRKEKIVYSMTKNKTSSGNSRKGDTNGVSWRMSQSTPDLLRRRADIANTSNFGLLTEGSAEGLSRSHAESSATLSEDSRSRTTSTDTLPSNRYLSTGELNGRGEERGTGSSYAENKSGYSVYSTWL